MGTGLNAARGQVNKFFNGREHGRSESGDAAAEGGGTGEYPEAGRPGQEAPAGQEQRPSG